jgi:acyl carrier protein
MTAPDREQLRRQVTETVAEVLLTPPAEVAAATSLFDLEGFDSLMVVAVLERLESGLGVEVDPDEIVPEAFDTVDALTEVIARAVHGRPAPTTTGGPA